MTTSTPVADATIAATQKACKRASFMGFHLAVKAAGFSDEDASKSLKDYEVLLTKRASLCATLAEAILGKPSAVFGKAA